MSINLNYTKSNSISGTIQISGSKSESNRLLILQKLFPEIQIENLSNSDDTKVLQRALKTTSDTIDIGHTGTAMRFLTAYFSIQEGKIITLTGSSRMQERPIKILVDALRDLGADITYLKNEGYPPLLIKGKKLSKNSVSILGNVSSQYISAFLLIASSLQEGIEIHLRGTVTSIPYIQMTLSLLNKIGVETSFNGKTIIVKQFKTLNKFADKVAMNSKTFFIEPDWSSASYFYSLAALHSNLKIELVGFKKKSIQGDSILPEIYKQFGVTTTFNKNGMSLRSNSNDFHSLPLTIDLANTPDLAQTIAVTYLGLGKNCYLTGLHTLKIKETNRLKALKKELEKFNAKVIITDDSLNLTPNSFPLKKNRGPISIDTYNDHRMAMAFAPLSVKIPLEIRNSKVVSKSYPNFWNDFNNLFN